MKDTQDDDYQEDEPKSKSQLKREMTALQELGETLAKLPNKEFARAPLDDNLREHLTLARTINSNSGKRRQMQYIGKLMRNIDTTEIATFLDELDTGRRAAARQFKQLEKMRDDIIERGDSAIDSLMQSHPQADRQQLRQLVRAVKKEHATNKPPASSRKLFKYLRSLFEE